MEPLRVVGWDLSLFSVDITLGFLFGYLSSSDQRKEGMLFSVPFLNNILIIIEAMERLNICPCITCKWTRFQIKMKPLFVGVWIGLFHLPLLFFALNGRGSQSIKKLEGTAQQWSLPRLGCASLQMGQPDIVGPGIWSTLITQTFITFLALAVSDTHRFIQRQLMLIRATRFILILSGFILTIKGEVSYYHLVALSALHHLLGMPEFFVVFQHLTLDREPGDYIVEKLMNLSGFLLATLLNLSLAFLSFQLWTIDDICLDATPSTMATKKTSDNYVIWNNGFLNAIILLQYIFLDGLLLLYPHIRKFPSLQTQSFHFYRARFLRSLAITIFASFSLNATIKWLNNVSDPTQQHWSFGQIFMVSGVGISSLLQWHEFSNGRMENGKLRYVFWANWVVEYGTGSVYWIVMKLPLKVMRFLWKTVTFLGIAMWEVPRSVVDMWRRRQQGTSSGNIEIELQNRTIDNDPSRGEAIAFQGLPVENVVYPETRIYA